MNLLECFLPKRFEYSVDEPEKNNLLKRNITFNFVFSLIWSLGITIVEKQRETMSKLI